MKIYVLSVKINNREEKSLLGNQVFFFLSFFQTDSPREKRNGWIRKKDAILQNHVDQVWIWQNNNHSENKRRKEINLDSNKEWFTKGYLWFPRSGGQGDIKMFIIYVTVHEVLAYQ